MLNFFDSSIFWVVLKIVVILIALYLSPFFLSPLIKIIVTLWGFLLGRRKRREVLVTYAPTSLAGSTPSPNQTGLEAEVKKVAENEFKMLEDGLNKKEARLKTEMDELEKKIEKLEKGFETRRTKVNDELVRKAFNNTKERLNEETGKNILFLIVVALILLVDTIIARQIFKSFGIGSEQFSIREISIEYAWIYGVFVTLVSALALHIFWETAKFKDFLKSKWSFVAGGMVVVAIFLIRIFTFTANPDSAQKLVDSLLIVCWLVGVLIVYWLLGEMTGEDKNWFKILVALCAPLLLVLLFLFGGILLFEFIIHWGVTHIIKAWLELRAARKRQIIQNSETSQNAQRSGFYRGLTM